MSDTVSNDVIKNQSWWQRRSTLEKSLVIISTLGGITIILLAITLNVISQKFLKEVASLNAEALQQLITDKGVNSIPIDVRYHPNLKIGKKDDYCITPGCIHAASSVLNHMDQSVEPCDDFYAFACGKFMRETNIPDDKTSVDTFSETDDMLLNQLRMILADPMRPDEIVPLQLVKKFYNLCMDEERIQEKGKQPLLELLKKMGGYPVLEGDSWDQNRSWTIENAIEVFQEYQIESSQIVQFSVTSDSKNSSLRIIDIDTASLGLDREYLVNGTEDKIVMAYYNYMVDMAVLLGAQRTRAESELLETLEFEIELAKISLPQEERRNQTLLYNPMTIREIQERYPYLDWLRLLRTMLTNTGVQIDESEVIVIEVPSYMENLRPLLQQTPNRVVANFFMRRLVQAAIKYLNNDLRERKLEYHRIVHGQQMEEPRWKECTNLVADTLQIAVGALYIRNFFKEESKEAAMEIVENLRTVFAKDIKTVKWMDEMTKNLAIEKAQNMNNHIGYPSELMDDTKIIEYYNSFTFNENSNFLNEVLRLDDFYRKKDYSKLRLPVNKTDWTEYSHVAVVNAYYASLDNGIQFPAGILQGHFFSYDRPKYMNYGSLGFIVGHEITHGFDDEGRQFDKNGNLVDWWQSETHQKFIDRAQCIIDQYGNYTDPEVKLHLNGINTQGENIADNGGLKHSYKAYMEWIKKNGEESKLPGIELSAKQMFWVSAAQSWCTKIRPESLKVKITTYHHAPGHFRVLGTISNRPEFASDYKCPEGSPMNPVKKCEVW